MPLAEEVLQALRINHPGYLAPKLRVQQVALFEMMTARGHDPVLFETLRLPKLQAEYYTRKTSRQRDVLRSMHGHGLAFDVISQSRGWNYSDDWKQDLQECCTATGLTCGGLWKNPVDWPHVQWGTIPGAVPDTLVAAFNAEGIVGSWRLVGAL